jgi:hypothetical protein
MRETTTLAQQATMPVVGLTRSPDGSNLDDAGLFYRPASIAAPLD